MGLELAIMVEVKEYCQQYREGNGNENVADINVPKMDEPTAVFGWEKSLGCGQRLQVDVGHSANMDKASEEDDGQWCAVVLNEYPDITSEKRSAAERAAQVSCHQDQKGHGDG